MATIRDLAQTYESPKTRNIAELSEVSTELDIQEREFIDKDGQPFTVNITQIEGEEYRVPNMVLKQLKVHLAEKPAMTKFKVKKFGEGLSTEYTVIPLD